MFTTAVVISKPQHVALERVELTDCGTGQVTVAIDWSGISTGTERLLWQGRMPHFPGMGYPLIPGYESVGRMVDDRSGNTESGAGTSVFVPGSIGFKHHRALFGGASRHVRLDRSKLIPLDDNLSGPQATLLALAATAYHALTATTGSRPDLIVGHGTLGRLLARLCIIAGGPPPVVWETSAMRRTGASGYQVIDPVDDQRRDYACIVDASGDAGLLDLLMQHLAPQGEIVLAGFYTDRLSFSFAPAFMREARIRVAAQFLHSDLIAVRDLAQAGKLNLNDLVTHREPAHAANTAYRTALDDAACLKMVLDWRQIS